EQVRAARGDRASGRGGERPGAGGGVGRGPLGVALGDPGGRRLLFGLLPDPARVRRQRHDRRGAGRTDVGHRERYPVAAAVGPATAVDGGRHAGPVPGVGWLDLVRRDPGIAGAGAARPRAVAAGTGADAGPARARRPDARRDPWRRLRGRGDGQGSGAEVRRRSFRGYHTGERHQRAVVYADAARGGGGRPGAHAHQQPAAHEPAPHRSDA
ncbi:MAG: NADH dehydrogenase, partial [uncultured Rubrobacteraceae bacterium]